MWVMPYLLRMTFASSAVLLSLNIPKRAEPDPDMEAYPAPQLYNSFFMVDRIG